MYLYIKYFLYFLIKKHRALPYYLHINLDYVETVHHIIGLLIEVPNMVLESMGQ